MDSFTECHEGLNLEYILQNEANNEECIDISANSNSRVDQQHYITNAFRTHSQSVLESTSIDALIMHIQKNGTSSLPYISLVRWSIEPLINEFNMEGFD